MIWAMQRQFHGVPRYLKTPPTQRQNTAYTYVCGIDPKCAMDMYIHGGLKTLLRMR